MFAKPMQKYEEEKVPETSNNDEDYDIEDYCEISPDDIGADVDEAGEEVIPMISAIGKRKTLKHSSGTYSMKIVQNAEESNRIERALSELKEKKSNEMKIQSESD